MSYTSAFGLIMLIILLGMFIYIFKAIYEGGKLKGREEGIKDVRGAVRKKDKKALDRLLYPRSDDFGRVRKPDAKWDVPRKTDS